MGFSRLSDAYTPALPGKVCKQDKQRESDLFGLRLQRSGFEG